MNKYYIILSFCCVVFLLSCQKQKEAVLSIVKAVVTETDVIDEDTVPRNSITPSDDVIEDDVSSEQNGESEDQVFLVVETMPEFPGGATAMMKFITDNQKYPVSARKNGIQGRVTVQFVINTDGSVTAVEVIRGIDPALDKEAIRIVKSMPKWKPGMQRGKAARVKYTIPVNFRLK